MDTTRDKIIKVSSQQKTMTRCYEYLSHI